MKIAVLLIELLLVRLRVGRAKSLDWTCGSAPQNSSSAEIRDHLIEGVFRLNEAEPGQEAVTPMQT
jgi:hypothetical protein